MVQKTRNGARARNYQDERFSFVVLRKGNRGDATARLAALAHSTLGQLLQARALEAPEAGRRRVAEEAAAAAAREEKLKVAGWGTLGVAQLREEFSGDGESSCHAAVEYPSLRTSPPARIVGLCRVPPSGRTP